jgi:hypothetical protein
MGVADAAGANEESAVGFGGSGWHGGCEGTIKWRGRGRRTAVSPTLSGGGFFRR